MSMRNSNNIIMPAEDERDRLHSLFMQTPAAIAILRGEDHVFEFANPLYLQLVGRTDNIIGKPVRDSFPEVIKQGFLELLDRVYATGEAYIGNETPIELGNDGDGKLIKKYLNFVYQPIRNINGHVDGIMVHAIDVTDQVLSRQMIEEGREQYLTLFNSIDQGFSVIEILFDKKNKPIDYRFLETNAVFEIQSGLKNATGKSIRELVPNYEKRWVEMYGRVALTGESIRIEDWSEAFRRWYDVYVTRVGGPSSRKVSVLFTDITQRKHAEEALKESEERFRIMADAAPNMVWALDSKGKLKYANNYTLEFLGVNAKDFTKQHWLSAIHQMDLKKIKRIASKAMRNKESFSQELRVTRRDGDCRWVFVQGTPSYYPNGELYGYIGSGIDITERRRAEQALRESQARFRDVSDNATTGLLIIGSRLRCTFMNPAAEGILGITKEEAQRSSKPLHDLIHHTKPDGSRYPVKDCPIVGVLSDKSKSTGEETFIRPDGTKYPVAYTASPIVTDGKITGTVIEIRDITDEKQARIEQQRLVSMTEQRNELLKLNKAKDEFIALASHQLRTPATAVKQYISLLMEGYAGTVPVEQLQYLRTAYESNEREIKIINDLLKTAQLDSEGYKLHKVQFNIVDIVQEIIREYQPVFDLKKQKVVLRIDEETVIALIDPKEIKLVLINLVENASKYSHPGTTVKISIQQKEQCLDIVIADKGVGISRDGMQKVFEKFTRIDNELSDTVTGTGLGLYWVKQIVELHGGIVKLASTPGKGSTFTVRLPI